MTIPYHEVILGLLALMMVVVLVNVVGFRRLPRWAAPERPGSEGTPMVSVLIPARNEERNIGTTLSTLARQDYPRMEIVVLNDNSADGTEAVVKERAGADPRIRLIQGGALPEGWVGKSYACHQLAGEAQGDLLLFVDADTAHEQWSVGAAVEEMRRSRADLLTVIPAQTMRTFWEKLILPLLHYSTFCFLPMPLVSVTRSPKLAMANGQFMLFRKEVYRAIGGHAGVRTAMVEDVWLSRRVKEEGYRLVIRDGTGSVRARMYRSLREIWQGFSKNLFAGFNYSLPMIGGVVVFNALTSVLPFILLPAGIIAGMEFAPWTAVVALQVALVLAIRLALAARFRLDVWTIVLHPLAMGIFCGIALNSARWVLVRGGARWKGRTYDFRNQPMDTHHINGRVST